MSSALIFVLFCYLFFSPVSALINSTYLITPDDIVLQFRSNDTVDDRVLVLEAYDVIKIRSINVPKTVRFAIVQVHSQIHDVTLSKDRKLQVANHVNGSSIGMHIEMSSTSAGVTAYLFNPYPFNITVLTFILFYDRTVPTPGGCNLEFEMEISPWLRVSYNNSSVVNVDHELAAVPPSRSNSLGCESELLHYDVFHYYMPERDFSEDTFFDAIRTLRTVKGAQQSGREIRSFGFIPTTRSLFGLYPGVGRVFAVTVTYIGSGGRYPVAAYVPAVTYGCDLRIEDDCQTLSSTYAKILCAVSLFVGLFMTFAGHRYFQLEMFLVGFVTFSTIFYVVLVNHFDSDVTGLAAGTSVIGLLGGILWSFVWRFWGIPALSVLPVVLMLGFIVSSLFFYLPISFEFLTNDFNFWSAFASCWLVLPVFFVTFTRLGNVVSCAIIGSYAVIVPIDHYIGSSLKYIVLNVVRRATVKGFGRAVLDPPYQDNDLILTLVWIGLAISGMAFQYVRERKRPPFSPPADLLCPWSWRRRAAAASSSSSHSDEQAPLITGSSASSSSATAGPHYGSV